MKILLALLVTMFFWAGRAMLHLAQPEEQRDWLEIANEAALFGAGAILMGILWEIW